MGKRDRRFLKFTQTITKFLALESTNLALSYLFGEEILWKEGWNEVLREPEFEKTGYTAKFTAMIDQFEKEIESFVTGLSLETQVYIGKENLISKSQDFSIIVSKFISPNCQGIFAILGPKRMSYHKNISLMNSLVKSLENC